jgi:hypothetical protein
MINGKPYRFPDKSVKYMAYINFIVYLMLPEELCLIDE